MRVYAQLAVAVSAPLLHGCSGTRTVQSQPRFSIPDGWTQLSEETAAALDTIPVGARADARRRAAGDRTLARLLELDDETDDALRPLLDGLKNGQYSLLAVDLCNLEADARMVAVVRPVPFLATNAWLRDHQLRFHREATSRMSRMTPGSTVHVLQADVVMVASTRAGRLSYDIWSEGRSVSRHLDYYLSVSGGRLAVVSYVATVEAFPAYLQAFEKSIQQTVGLKEPPLVTRLRLRGSELLGRPWWR
jgi:hypothetical protein